MEDGDIQRRLRQWREQEGLTLRNVYEAVNEHLPENRKVSLGTVSNYEKGPDALQEEAPHPSPRSDFVAALREAFPHLSVGWILTGRGAMYDLDRVGRPSLRDEIQKAYPEFRDLPVGMQELFLDLLSQYATRSEAGFTAALQGDRGYEEAVVESAGDLLFLLKFPAKALSHGRFETTDEWESYLLAMLNAVRLAIPEGGPGADVTPPWETMARKVRRILEGNE